MKRLASTIVAISILMLTGCTDDTAPKCSDKDVKNTIKNIYKEWSNNINNSDNPMFYIFKGNIPNSIISFDSPRTMAYDEEIKLRTCKIGITLDDDTTAIFGYTVQLNEEDLSNFYVEIDEKSLEEIAQASLMKNLMKKMSED